MLNYLKDILSDEKNVKRNAVIQIVIVTVSFIMLMRVYPFSTVKLNTASNGQAFSVSLINILIGGKLACIKIILKYIAIIAAAAVVYLLTMRLVNYWDCHFEKYNDSFNKYLRIAVSVITAAAGIFIIVFAVVLNKFGSPKIDRFVYFIAAVAAVLWVYAALWIPYLYPNVQKDYNIPAKKRIGVIWRNYIQTVSFGLLFYALCQYVNADREYYHYTNTRWMLIFLAIAFLMMLSERLFVNKLSLIWLVAGWLYSAHYCNGFAADENEYMLARLTCGVVVSWGLLVINLLIQMKTLLKRKINVKDKILFYLKKRKQQIIYAVLYFAFVMLMYKYRFEKVWVFTATLPFMALFFMRLTPQAKSRFLKNFTNGILLSFGFVTLFCLMHRPHHYWMLYRYGGIFHTVACTGMYLSVVFGAAVAKLYGRLRDRKNMFRRCFGDFFAVSCVAEFVLLTMSRTALITIAVTFVAVMLLSAFTYKKTLKRIVHELVMIAGAVIVGFPLVFTSLRMIPALVNNPVRYEVEFQDESFMICKDDPVDSDKYMTVGRFFSTFLGRFHEEGDTSDAEACGENTGETDDSIYMLAYTGNDFAKVNMRTASADSEENEESGKNETAFDISNGRFDIFKGYFNALELKGHPKMGFDKGDGTDYVHAHNSYLQVAYNFGIIAGIIFLLICAVSLWRAARLAVTQGRKYSIFFVPFALILVFGFVSITEWAFHPCIPAGFCFLLLQVILIRE